MSGPQLDYKGRQPESSDKPEPGNPIAAGLCVVGAGLIGIAGALLIGLGDIAAASRGGGDRFASGLGCIVMFVAAVLLVVAFIQWIRTG